MLGCLTRADEQAWLEWLAAQNSAGVTQEQFVASASAGRPRAERAEAEARNAVPPAEQTAAAFVSAATPRHRKPPEFSEHSGPTSASSTSAAPR